MVRPRSQEVGEFQRRYQAEMKGHEVALEPILQAARHGTVTLLYSSHDTEHDNAVVLRGYLERKLGAIRSGKIVCRGQLKDQGGGARRGQLRHGEAMS